MKSINDVSKTDSVRELTMTEVQNVSGGVGVAWGGSKHSAWVHFFLGKRPGRG